MKPKLILPASLKDHLEACKALLRQKSFVDVGQGSYRHVFQRKNIVIKVPLSLCGLEDNILEAYAYQKFRKASNENGYVFAPCRLLSNGCLMMIHVDIYHRNNLPDWTRYIDGGQCGWYHDRVVAYDSACDINDMRVEAMAWANLLSDL